MSTYLSIDVRTAEIGQRVSGYAPQSIEAYIRTYADKSMTLRRVAQSGKLKRKWRQMRLVTTATRASAAPAVAQLLNFERRARRAARAGRDWPETVFTSHVIHLEFTLSVASTALPAAGMRRMPESRLTCSPMVRVRCPRGGGLFRKIKPLAPCLRERVKSSTPVVVVGRVNMKAVVSGPRPALRRRGGQFRGPRNV
ncbi:hypothetical protein EVAR_29660_1 [Eumeta japonica]|uniref:Uncharacterized protein n=1 Tax=Eumeta variegata TaxID=151549 RepID=A0A4C1WA84_EUMVA|nr:hypothetical protein EVAR_29660_1 [Eumeta japonica]